MVLYKCEKCLKEFNKKSNYLMHIEHRKTPCNNEIIHNKVKLLQNISVIVQKFNLLKIILRSVQISYLM